MPTPFDRPSLATQALRADVVAPRDTVESAGGDPALGPLPRWDFSGLYPGDQSAVAKAIDADFDWAEAEIKRFADDYEGRLAGLDAAGLLRMIERYEAFEERLGRAMSYLSLRYQQDSLDAARAKAMGDAEARATHITAPLVFLTLEINGLDDAALEARLVELDALARYRPWFERVRKMRPHQLSMELEKFIHDLSVVGASAWRRLFDETLAGLTFAVERDGGVEEMALEPTLTLMLSPNRAERAAAGAALAQGFAANIRLFTLVTNTLAKEKEIHDRWRRLPTPQASRHLSNEIEPEVVRALRDAVVEAYPRLSHRYYTMKAGWLGLDKLEYWDRNAPLPNVEARTTSWDEARDTVLGAYGAFAPRMADIARRFFENDWIDAPASRGKSPGAFAHPTVASAHPFIMLNYLGKPQDVMTLAHELGHGVHQVLAAEQGELLSRTPLTLAETASVFGEMLTFKRVLAQTEDVKLKKSLLAEKVESMINTVIRQIAFYDFESRVHAARREGELTSEALGEIWLAVQHESLGEAFHFADGYENFWAYVPHFIHTPFYVYAYAFGDGLVNALYAVYEDGAASDFETKYFEMLSAGGAKSHTELLAPFGLDASNPAFWSKGLGVIESMIDELAAIEA